MMGRGQKQGTSVRLKFLRAKTCATGQVILVAPDLAVSNGKSYFEFN